MTKLFAAIVLTAASTIICFADQQQQTEHTRLTQIYTQAIRQGNKNFDQNPYKISKPFADSSDKKKAATDNDNKQDNSKALPVCNCYDTSDPNNYSGNFLYSADKVRIKRLQPACKCKSRNDDTGNLPVANINNDNSQQSNNSKIQTPSTFSTPAQRDTTGGITGNLNAPNASTQNQGTKNSSNNFNYGISYN